MNWYFAILHTHTQLISTYLTQNAAQSSHTHTSSNRNSGSICQQQTNERTKMLITNVKINFNFFHIRTDYTGITRRLCDSRVENNFPRQRNAKIENSDARNKNCMQLVRGNTKHTPRLMEKLYTWKKLWTGLWMKRHGNDTRWYTHPANSTNANAFACGTPERESDNERRESRRRRMQRFKWGEERKK